MNLKEFLKFNQADNEKAFGNFVKQRREELNISVRKLASTLDMTASYLSDIENGKRYAPVSKLVDFMEVLYLDKGDLDLFTDLAYLSRGQVTPDILQYLIKNPKLRSELEIERRDKILTENSENNDLSL